LTEESRLDLENNPLNLLNPKSEDEEILLENAPKITKFLKKDSKKHYTSLKEYLDILEVPYKEKASLI
jgi:histidyl-tRNA synthetase